ncbi:MAG: amidase [Rhodospirillaceae bacterium]|nr:amidase [Rhodospirillaceae bacterium]
MKPIPSLAADLAEGRTTSRALVDEALARIDDKDGEGSRAFIKVWHARARAEADLWDQVRKLGQVALPLAGVPIAVKDLFDIAGEPTTAGSTALKDAAPAKADAVIVQRLRAAGAVLVGRTNMTEFAYSGIGLNPHYGTPKNPWDRARGRIPGGSSSGAAISAADGMCAGSIGSDTGGSVRIPAALCGLAGIKPTASRIPLTGAFPLSFSQDSIGPLAKTLASCAILDAVMADEPAKVPEARPVMGLRLGVVRTLVLDALDATVSAAWERTLKKLAAAGAHLIDVDMPDLPEIPKINARGGFSAPEAYAHHRETIAAKAAMFDPLVLSRIKRGAEMPAADYIDIMRIRHEMIGRARSITRPFDAVIMPTCPIVAPALDEVATPETFMQKNAMVLRNTSLFNFLDRCAITLPIQGPSEGPVGLMLVGEHGHDKRLIAAGLGIEAMLAGK